MIKNISDRTVILRWNLRDFTVKPSDAFDVTKFGVTDPKHILQLEDRFVSKYRGQFEKVSKEESAIPAPTAPAEGQGVQEAAGSPGAGASSEGAKKGAGKKKTRKK